MTWPEFIDFFRSSVLGNTWIWILLLTIITGGLPIVWYYFFFDSFYKLMIMDRNKIPGKFAVFWKVPLSILTYPFFMFIVVIPMSTLDANSFQVCFMDCNEVGNIDDKYLLISKYAGGIFSSLYTWVLFILFILSFLFIHRTNLKYWIHKKITLQSLS